MKGKKIVLWCRKTTNRMVSKITLKELTIQCKPNYLDNDLALSMIILRKEFVMVAEVRDINSSIHIPKCFLSYFL